MFTLGARRAYQLFLSILALQVPLFVMPLRHLPPTNRWVSLAVGLEWLYGGLFTLGAIALSAGIIHSRLDRDQRKPFWLASLVCFVVFVFIWIGAGVALQDLVR